MPIYAYRCAECGHTKDVLRKLADPPLTRCPACNAEAFTKQLTAAGFQLKGSGWYATDFKGGGKAKPDAKPADDAAEVKSGVAAAAAAPDSTPAAAAPDSTPAAGNSKAGAAGCGSSCA